MQNVITKVQIFNEGEIEFDSVNSKANAKYPWVDLKVGQSFGFPTELKFPKPQIYQANQRYKDKGMQFELRKKGNLSFAKRVA